MGIVLAGQISREPGEKDPLTVIFFQSAFLFPSQPLLRPLSTHIPRTFPQTVA